MVSPLSELSAWRRNTSVPSIRQLPETLNRGFTNSKSISHLLNVPAASGLRQPRSPPPIPFLLHRNIRETAKYFDRMVRMTRHGQRISLSFITIGLFLAAVTANENGQGGLGQPKVRCESTSGFVISGVITGYAPQKNLYLALYANGADFDRARFCRSLRFPADSLPKDSIRYRFTNIPPGYYMIASYQDMDDDGIMTRGFMGVPKDPFRIHLPNYGMFGPKFDKCRFHVEADYSKANIDFSEGKK